MKRKTLGQYLYEVTTADWWCNATPKMKKDWQRIAQTFAREVKRRQKGKGTR